MSEQYTIERAIALIQALPVERDEQLVVDVVRMTLESAGVSVPSLVADAGRRQQDLRGRIQRLKETVADLQQEIRQRKHEITELRDNYDETTRAKEHLLLAEKAEITPDAAPSPSGVTAPPAAEVDYPATAVQSYDDLVEHIEQTKKD